MFQSKLLDFLSEDPNFCINNGINKNLGDLPDPGKNRRITNQGKIKMLTKILGEISKEELSFDDQINYDKHLSIILFMMKHIHQRDKLKLIADIFKNCHKAILIDQEQDYVYTKLMIWYNDCKIPLNKKQEFEQLVLDHLPKEKGEEIMRTIADSYIDEGVSKGILIGEARGEARGVEKGKMDGINQRNIEIAKRMLQEKVEMKFVASVTGLTTDEVLKLQNRL